MKKTNIKRASLDNIRKMNEAGKLANPAGEDLGPDFWADAMAVAPSTPRSVHLKLDPEVFDFFKRNGKGHLTRIRTSSKPM